MSRRQNIFVFYPSISFRFFCFWNISGAFYFQFLFNFLSFSYFVSIFYPKIRMFYWFLNRVLGKNILVFFVQHRQEKDRYHKKNSKGKLYKHLIFLFTTYGSNRKLFYQINNANLILSTSNLNSQRRQTVFYWLVTLHYDLYFAFASFFSLFFSFSNIII